MKKTIFALLLLIALVAVLAIPAMAAEGTLENHCVCGDKACDGTPSKADDEHVMQTWQAWDGTGTPKTSGYWYLTGDVNSSVGAQATFAVNGELGIDLNGHTIKGVAPQYTNLFFEVGANAKLTLTDYEGTGVIDYLGTAVNYGNVIRVTGSNAVVNIFGGTMTANNKTINTGGACVFVGSGASGSVVNMYGGVLENGICTSDNAVRGGGNVTLCEGTFNMYGGIVRNGKASGGHKNGGNFFVANGALNIWGGKVLGGEADRGSAIYDYLGHIRLYGGVVSSGTTDTDLVTGVYSDTTNTRNLILCGAKKIRLEGDVLNFRSEKPVELDLNGYTVTKAVVRGTAANLMLSDSQTADYTVADNKYGKVTTVVFEQEATAAANMTTDFVNSSKQRFVTVKGTDGYSAHRIFLSVSHYVLPDDANGLNYKTTFKCDEVIAGLVGKNYGIVVTNGDQTSDPISYNADVVANNDNAKTAQVNGFLVKATETGADKNAENAAKTIKVKAYIQIGDETINSSEKSTTFAEVVAKTETMELDDAQKTILKNLYNDYNVAGFMDSWWIKSLAA